MIDKFLLKFFGFFDDAIAKVEDLLTFNFNNITTMFKCKRPCCKDKEKTKNNKYFKG